MSKKEFAADALLAAEISVLFVSAVFMYILLSCELLPLAFIYLAVSVGLVWFCLVSKNPFDRLAKVLLCIPFSLPVFVFFWKTNFAVRAINRVYPGYGRESGGSRSANGLLILMYGVACLICALAALTASSPENQKERRYIGKKQIMVGSAAAAITVMAVLLLAPVFPPISSISGQG